MLKPSRRTPVSSHARRHIPALRGNRMFFRRPACYNDGREENTPSPISLMVLIRCSTGRQSEAFGPHVQVQFVTAW